MKDLGVKAWLALAVLARLGPHHALSRRARSALLERRMGGGPTAEKRPAQRLIMWCTSIGFVALLV
jgi:hypothetical protein